LGKEVGLTLVPEETRDKMVLVLTIPDLAQVLIGFFLDGTLRDTIEEGGG